MVVKKYKDFIKENLNSLGEEIESIYHDDYIKNIVNRYIEDIDPSIRIANAINLLDDRTQKEIKSQVDDYLQNGIEEKEPTVITSTETDDLLEESMAQEEISVAGKGVFSSFLKSLTALGKKDNKANFDICPDDFLIYYQLDNLLSEDVKTIFKRFKSLFRYINLIDYGKNEVNLYFGIKTDGYFEYGISYESRLPIGQFKLNKSTINWILRLESKSAESLKKDLVNLSFNDILILGKIKTDMIDYRPGYFESKSPVYINDKVISFGYYGFGNWNNGKLSEEDLLKTKSDFSNWVIDKKWGTKVLVSINPKSFWLNIHLKLK